MDTRTDYIARMIDSTKSPQTLDQLERTADALARAINCTTDQHTADTLNEAHARIVDRIMLAWQLRF